MKNVIKNLKLIYRPARYELVTLGQIMKRGDGKGRWLPSLYKRKDAAEKYIINVELSLALDILNGYVKPDKKVILEKYWGKLNDWNKAR